MKSLVSWFRTRISKWVKNTHHARCVLGITPKSLLVQYLVGLIVLGIHDLIVIHFAEISLKDTLLYLGIPGVAYIMFGWLVIMLFVRSGKYFHTTVVMFFGLVMLYAAVQSFLGHSPREILLSVAATAALISAMSTLFFTVRGHTSSQGYASWVWYNIMVDADRLRRGEWFKHPI